MYLFWNIAGFQSVQILGHEVEDHTLVMPHTVLEGYFSRNISVTLCGPASFDIHQSYRYMFLQTSFVTNFYSFMHKYNPLFLSEN
jgi:hypothetical protein